MVVVAGVPQTFGNSFYNEFCRVTGSTKAGNTEVLWKPLCHRNPYTGCYAGALYDRLVGNLKKTWQDRNATVSTGLVLLYVDRKDGSESNIFDMFESEAFIMPIRMSWPDIIENIKNPQVAKLLACKAKTALSKAKKLLQVIWRQVNQTGKTPLLLPRQNFGKDMDTVFKCVQDAALQGYSAKEFEKEIKGVSGRLPKSKLKSKNDGRWFFKKRNGLIFKIPNRRARHAVAPLWEECEHAPSCVIRGRLRFGAPYAPNFHYDCITENDNNLQNLQFFNCHGPNVQIPAGRSHVNISPNDNIR